jgi:hypothetical protein
MRISKFAFWLGAAWLCFAAGNSVAAAVRSRDSEPGQVATVEVTPATATAEVGTTLQFSALAKDASGKVLDIQPTVWFAAPFDVAGSDQTGKVTFHNPGQVTVGVIIGKKPGYAYVTVAKPPVASIQVAEISQALPVGGIVSLSAVPISKVGSTRTDVAVSWKSRSPAIAKIDAAGVVTALAPGTAKLEASASGVTAQTSVHVVPDTIGRIAVDPSAATARTGDVVHFHVSKKDAAGGELTGVVTHWAVSGAPTTSAEPSAEIYEDGGFVADTPGTYVVSASVGGHVARASIKVKPRNAERQLEVLAHVQPKDDNGAPLQTAEEWIIHDHAYLSTIGDRVFLYDISDPSNPKLLDTLKVDARLVNDVSTTPDEKLGVMTREEASNRRNGIVFLDLSQPGKLQVESEYTETVTGGVHSAFLNRHYAYITDDATGSLRVIDFQDPKHPQEVARWQTENATAVTIVGPTGPLSSGRYLHDLYVKDGLAYLAYWRDGLVILDVGSGIKGGSPEHPQLVSQFKINHYELYGDGWLAGVHNTFRYKNYVFVGDEVFPAQFNVESKDRIPVRAICHVIDVSDITNPREVAFYEVPEGGTHNFWADDDMLFEGDYAGGGRVLDISGELRGDLYRQGREVARLWTGDPNGYRANMPFAWGAQPYNGLIFVNDINTGLWIARLGKPVFKGSATAPGLQEMAK